MTHALTIDRFRLRTAVGFLCALCALSGADAPRPEREVLEQARQRITGMSADKRDQLRKSFEAFRNLPAERQEQIQKLHDDVQADPGLKDVMQKYCEWVVTLDPGPQSELRSESQVHLKIKLVKKYREEQATERTSHDWAETGFFRELKRMPKLDDAQLSEIVAHLEKFMSETLKSDEKLKLATLSGPPRHSQILAYAVDREIEQSDIPVAHVEEVQHVLAFALRGEGEGLAVVREGALRVKQAELLEIRIGGAFNQTLDAL